MKILNTLCIIILLIAISCNKPSYEIETNKKLQHIVLLKFKDKTSKDSIAIIEKAFANLPNKIKEIKDFEWGTNNSPEGLDKGFT
ncbi:MAG: Dabb family protein, partial [Flavobacteriaceae bacterium]|nr:Dabb family protein [Flavobacteriaceae bacterium]